MDHRFDRSFHRFSLCELTVVHVPCYEMSRAYITGLQHVGFTIHRVEKGKGTMNTCQWHANQKALARLGAACEVKGQSSFMKGQSSFDFVVR